jgi:hypothetical protein
MGKRSHIQSGLQQLSNADLLDEAQRGNEAARALLVDRTMYDVVVLFHKKWLPLEAVHLAWSAISSEMPPVFQRGWILPEADYPNWSDFLKEPNLDSERRAEGEIIWKLANQTLVGGRPIRTVHDIEEVWGQLSPAAQQRVNRYQDLVDTALAEFLGVHPTEVSTSSYIAFLLLRMFLQRRRAESAATAEAEETGDPQPTVEEQSWREFLGPLLTREKAKQRIGIASDSEIDALVSTTQLLALPTSSGEFVYPEFQFSRDGVVYPGIEQVLKIFSDVVATPYTIASWLRGPKDYLEGNSPIEWLAREQELEPVIKGAELAAALLAQ